MNRDEYEERKSRLDREQLIDGIINNYFDEYRGKNNEKQSIAIFIGGGSGSGKSTLRKKLVDSGELPNCLVIDSDILKKIIPEYSALSEEVPEMAASIVHEESSVMASKLFEKALEEKINFIFDATMKNTGKYEDFFSKLKSNGFQIELIITTVSIETAKSRNRQRFEYLKKSGQPARLVPDNIVEGSHEKVVESFEKLKDLADNWIIIDTEDTIKIVAVKGKICDEQLYQKFIGNDNWSLTIITHYNAYLWQDDLGNPRDECLLFLLNGRLQI